MQRLRAAQETRSEHAMELSDTTSITARERHLEWLSRDGALESATGLAALVLAVAALFGSVPQLPLLSWAAVSALVYTGRYTLLRAYRRAGDTVQWRLHWQILLIASVAATACAWGGMAAWVIAARGLDLSYAPVLLVVALTFVAIMLFAGSLPCALAQAVGALVPPVLGLLALGTAAALAVALALVGAGAAALLGARTLHRRLAESAVLQGENEQLRGYLDRRREQIEKLQVELKTTHGKHEQAEQNLRRTAADLGLAQGKAKALAETLERISPLDQVTGLDNRRQFDQSVEMEWRRAARNGRSIAMLVVDVDDFETYVEAYGHQSADVLLKRIGQTLKSFGRRAGDTAGRYAESRVALVLPDCDVRNATRIGETVRKRIEAQRIPHLHARGPGTLTVHVGVAMLKPSRSLPPAELVKRVEAALYEARFQGGNKVVAYQPLGKLRLERWDPGLDGALNEQSLIQKLLVWGYDTRKELLQPGSTNEPRILNDELVVATLAGELAIDIEGHTMTLQPGDCVFVPAGVEAGMEVVGTKPVVTFTATRHR